MDIIFIFALLFLIGIIGIIVSCNGDTSAANNKLEELFANRFVSIVASIIIAFVNIFIIKLLYDKYYNYSNIENYKRILRFQRSIFLCRMKMIYQICDISDSLVLNISKPDAQINVLGFW